VFWGAEAERKVDVFERVEFGCTGPRERREAAKSGSAPSVVMAGFAPRTSARLHGVFIGAVGREWTGVLMRGGWKGTRGGMRTLVFCFSSVRVGSLWFGVCSWFGHGCLSC